MLSYQRKGPLRAAAIQLDHPSSGVFQIVPTPQTCRLPIAPSDLCRRLGWLPLGVSPLARQSARSLHSGSSRIRPGIRLQHRSRSNRRCTRRCIRGWRVHSSLWHSQLQGMSSAVIFGVLRLVSVFRLFALHGYNTPCRQPCQPLRHIRIRIILVAKFQRLPGGVIRALRQVRG